MRWTMLAAAMLLLAGCYESRDQLLDQAAARQPIVTAKDWTYGSAARRVHARLAPKPNGWYDYAEARLDLKGREGPWKTYAVVLNTLATANGYELYAYGTYNADDHGYMYGIVAVGADGFWQTVAPSCDPVNADVKWYAADLKAAKAAGAHLKAIDEVEDVCHFTTREQLFTALRGVIAQPGFWDRIRAART